DRPPRTSSVMALVERGKYRYGDAQAEREEVRRRTWLCACDDMKRFKYCHCLLFVRPDGRPITEHLPEGHEGRAAWGLVADPTPGSGRESGRSLRSGLGDRTEG